MLQPTFGSGIFLIWILATLSAARNMLKKTCWGTFDTSEPLTWGEKHKSTENCIRKIAYSLNSVIKRKCKLLLCGMSLAIVDENPLDTDVIQNKLTTKVWKGLTILLLYRPFCCPTPPQLRGCWNTERKFQVLLSVQHCMRDRRSGGGRGGGGWGKRLSDVCAEASKDAERMKIESPGTR